MKQTEDLSIALQAIAVLRVGKLTPARLHVVNNYIMENTEESIRLDSNGEIIYLKDCPYEIDINKDKITINCVLLFPTELKSVGLRTTPVEF